MTEGEVGLGIPTLLRTEARVVGVVHSNEVSFLLSDRARVARVSSFSTSLACHARIHNLVGLLVRRLQLLHEKVHLGSAHIDTVDVVNSVVGLLPPISFPTLVGSNLLYQHLRSSDVEREKGTTLDDVRLCLFPFSLLGKAKTWFYSNKEAFTTWEVCSNAFLASGQNQCPPEQDHRNTAIIE